MPDSGLACSSSDSACSGWQGPAVPILEARRVCGPLAFLHAGLRCRYSERKACIGSTVAARRAGMKLAMNAARANTTVTAPSV